MSSSSRNGLPSSPNSLRCCCGQTSRPGDSETIRCSLCLKQSHKACYALRKHSQENNGTDEQNFKCIYCFAEMYEPFFEVGKVLHMKLVPNGTTVKDESSDFQIHENFINVLDQKDQILFFFLSMNTGKNFFKYDQIDVFVNGEICKNYGPKSALYLKELLRPGRRNQVKVNSNRKKVSGNFSMLVCVGKSRKKTEIMKKVMKRSTTMKPKQSILMFQQQNQEANGQDLVFTNQNIISVCDPTTLQRLDLPARGKNCTHLECFSLDTFIKMNKTKEAKRRWTCPICKDRIFWPDIYFDEEFLNIINAVFPDSDEDPKRDEKYKDIMFDGKTWKKVSIEEKKQQQTGCNQGGSDSLLSKRPMGAEASFRDIDDLTSKSYSPKKTLGTQNGHSNIKMEECLNDIGLRSRMAAPEDIKMESETFEISPENITIEFLCQFYQEIKKSLSERNGELEYEELARKMRDSGYLQKMLPQKFYEFIKKIGLDKFSQLKGGDYFWRHPKSKLQSRLKEPKNLQFYDLACVTLISWSNFLIDFIMFLEIYIIQNRWNIEKDKENVLEIAITFAHLITTKKMAINEEDGQLWDITRLSGVILGLLVYDLSESRLKDLVDVYHFLQGNCGSLVFHYEEGLSPYYFSCFILGFTQLFDFDQTLEFLKQAFREELNNLVYEYKSPKIKFFLIFFHIIFKGKNLEIKHEEWVEAFRQVSKGTKNDLSEILTVTYGLNLGSFDLCIKYF